MGAGAGGGSCCSHPLNFRRNTTDFSVFEQASYVEQAGSASAVFPLARDPRIPSSEANALPCLPCLLLQIFIHHYMSFMYPLSATYEPKYILDAGVGWGCPVLPGQGMPAALARLRPLWHPSVPAGANVGLASVLFKLLWPDAVVVALEPDADNFAMLQANTRG